MGPIPSSHNSNERYFLDLYTPSYTPTLYPRRISQGKPTDGNALDTPCCPIRRFYSRGIKIIQQVLKARVTVTDLVSSEATPSSVVKGL